MATDEGQRLVFDSIFRPGLDVKTEKLDEPPRSGTRVRTIVYKHVTACVVKRDADGEILEVYIQTPRLIDVFKIERAKP